MHQGKLNLRQSIYDSSGSRASVFAILRITSEGPEDVASISRLTSLIYSYREMGWSLYGRERAMVDSCWGYLFLWSPRSGISAVVPSMMSLPYSGMP